MKIFKTFYLSSICYLFRNVILKGGGGGGAVSGGGGGQCIIVTNNAFMAQSMSTESLTAFIIDEATNRPVFYFLSLP